MNTRTDYVRTLPNTLADTCEYVPPNVRASLRANMCTNIVPINVPGNSTPKHRSQALQMLANRHTKAYDAYMRTSARGRPRNTSVRTYASKQT